MTFEEIPERIKEQLEAMVRAALPEVAGVYKDRTDPGGFQRPAVLLYVGAAREAGMDRETVAVAYDVTVTGLVTVANDMRSHFPALDRLGSGLLACFLVPSIEVGGLRMDKGPAALDLRSMDGAEVTFTLTTRLERSSLPGQETETATMMEHLHTNHL